MKTNHKAQKRLHPSIPADLTYCWRGVILKDFINGMRQCGGYSINPAQERSELLESPGNITNEPESVSILLCLVLCSPAIPTVCQLPLPWEMTQTPNKSSGELNDLQLINVEVTPNIISAASCPCLFVCRVMSPSARSSLGGCGVFMSGQVCPLG
ncbi:unnamed protein product [Caretta caretta]